MASTNNILTEKNFDFDSINPSGIAKTISKQFKAQRLELNITQEELARKSGVSLGSVKRFENKAEISLKSLLLLALVLNSTDEFLTLFSKKQYKSISQIVDSGKVNQRKRARKRV